MKSRIGKQDSKEISQILTRIRDLFDRYYEFAAAVPPTQYIGASAVDKIVSELEWEMGGLRDHLWHLVDRGTAAFMDEEEDLPRLTREVILAYEAKQAELEK